MPAESGNTRATGKSRLPSTHPPERRWVARLRQPDLKLFGLALLTASFIGFLSLDYVRIPADALSVGDIAERDIRAPKTTSVVDEVATRDLRNQAEALVRPVFDFTPQTAEHADRRIQDVFRILRRPGSTGGEGEPDQPPDIDTLVAERRDELTSALGVEIATRTLMELARNRHDELAEQVVRDAVREALSGYVVSQLEQLPLDMRERGISVMELDPTAPRERSLRRQSEILSLEDARRAVEVTLRRELKDRSPSTLSALVTLGQEVLNSNLTYNAAQTQQRRVQAREAVPEVTYVLKKGTVIVRAGDPVDSAKYQAIQALTRAQEETRGGLMFLAATSWALMVIVVVFQFASRFIRKFNPSVADVAVMSIICVFILAVTRVGMEISHALAATSPSIPASSYHWLLPVAAGAMLIRILMNSETALAFSLVTAAFAALILDTGLFVAVFFLISGITAAGGISHTKERVHVLRSGLLTGVVNAVMVLTIYLVAVTDATAPDSATSGKLVFDLLFAFTGGIVSAVMVLGLLPFFEMFGYVTDNKLLELANLNHPLLKEMMVQAPGSYHHSVIVGSLSEAACEAIGANALLARVGCYFHDIGKMKKASYFIENLRDMENKHDRLAPSMSALIIASHVREGIELGRRYKLPQPLIDLIPQHHGTALISFFYNKAKQMEDLDLSPVDENDYRYPGPRPQTREAGVVMLADATEASTRSIKQPTSAKIRANIQKIFNRILTDGQLDECPLTLKDLAVIGDTFHDVLLGIYHTRIQYPAEYKPKTRPRGTLTAASTGGRPLTTEEIPVPVDLGSTQELNVGPRRAEVPPKRSSGVLDAATTTADPVLMTEDAAPTAAVSAAEPREG